MLQYYVLIFENLQTKPPNLLCPRAFAGVILMIAGDEVGAVTRRELRKGFRVLRQLVHRTIHQITRHGNQVSLQVVHPANDAFDESALDGGSYMYVADLRDRKAVQRLREVLNRNVYFDQSWSARNDESDERSNDRQRYRVSGRRHG